MPDPKKQPGRPLAATRIDVDAEATARRRAEEQGTTRAQVYRNILHAELKSPTRADTARNAIDFVRAFKDDWADVDLRAWADQIIGELAGDASELEPEKTYTLDFSFDVSDEDKAAGVLRGKATVTRTGCCEYHRNLNDGTYCGDE